MSRGRKVSAFLVASVLVLAGCGSSSQEATFDSGPSTAGSVDSPQPAPAAPAGPAPSAVQVYLDAAGMRSGPVEAATSGQPATATFGHQPLRYRAGEIVHDNGSAVGTATAGYVEYRTTGRVHRVGVVARWQPGSVGAVALVLPSAKWAQDRLPDAGVHLVIFGNGEWHCSKWAAGEQVYASDVTTGHRFGDVRDGEPHVVDLTETPDGAARLVLPDGSVVTFRNGAIAADVSDYAVFELFESNDGSTAVPASIDKLWVA